MSESRPQPCNRYRLMVDDPGGERAAVAEVESRGPEAALHLAQRLYPGRYVEIVENDQPLARVRNVAGAGYWVVEPSSALHSITAVPPNR